MIENQNNNEDGFELVQTKVPAHIKQLLDILAGQRDMSTYELLQLLINGFITTAKADGPLSPQMKMLIEVLQTDTSWKGAFSFTGISGTTDVEQRAVIDAGVQAGARKTFLIEEPVAAALGAGIDIFSPTGKMIIDIGGGTTDVAVISLGGVVVSKSIKVAGNKFDAAIMKYMRRKYNVIIGERTAELVKMKIGAVYEHPVAKEFDVKGRCLLQGLPKVVKVSSKEMLEAMMEPITEVLDAIYAVIESTPPELIGDILKGGIVMTGGSSLLYGLDKLIEELTGIKTRVAERPELCVVKGTGEALKYLSGQSDGVLDLSKARTKTKGAKK